MKSNLFFQGDIRIGKSTHLRKTINTYNLNIVGMTVQRVFCQSQFYGFQASYVTSLPLAEVDIPYQAQIGGIFLSKQEQKSSIVEDIIQQIVDTVISSKIKPFIILDEIGGIELQNSAVRKSLQEILQSDAPTVGILKSRKNLLHAIDRNSLYPILLDYWDELSEILRSSNSLHTISHDNLEQIDMKSKLFIEFNQACKLD